MKNTLKTLTLALAAGLLASSSLFAAGTSTTATTLSVTVASEAVFTVAPSLGTTNLVNGSVGNFAGTFQGSTGFTYKVRTGASAGGTITLSLSDFTGMSPAPLPIAAGFLTFTATTPTAGVTVASGTSTLTKSMVGTPQTFITFGNDTHSASAGDSGNINWVLADDPSYITGTWTATATFTISVT